MNIFTTIAAFFSMISTLISGVNRLANAGDKYCSIAEAHAETTHKQYILKEQANTRILEQQLAELESTSSVKTENP